MLYSIRSLIGAVVAVLLSAGIAVAGDIGKPTGPILLTVGGHVANTNGDGIAQFDAALLKGLGLRTITTSTTWTKGKSKFRAYPLDTHTPHI